MRRVASLQGLVEHEDLGVRAGLAKVSGLSVLELLLAPDAVLQHRMVVVGVDWRGVCAAGLVVRALHIPRPLVDDDGDTGRSFDLSAQTPKASAATERSTPRSRRPAKTGSS